MLEPSTRLAPPRPSDFTRPERLGCVVELLFGNTGALAVEASEPAPDRAPPPIDEAVLDRITLNTGEEFIGKIELIGEDTLDFDTTFQWDYVADPQANSDGNVPESSDFRITVSLALDL